MDNEECVQLAMQLGIEPLEIIIAADLDRAERTGKHSAWEIFLERTKAAAASVLIAVLVNLFLTPNPSEAAPPLTINHTATTDSLYIM